MNTKIKKLLHSTKVVLFILFAFRPDFAESQDSPTRIINITSITENSISFTLAGELTIAFYSVDVYYYPLGGWDIEDDTTIFGRGNGSEIHITYSDLFPRHSYQISATIYLINLTIVNQEIVVHTPGSCFVCIDETNNKDCSEKLLCEPDQNACLNVVEYLNGIPRITKSCANNEMKNDRSCLGEPRNGLCKCLCSGNLCNKKMMPCITDFIIQSIGASAISIDASELELKRIYTIEIFLLPWNQTVLYQTLSNGNIHRFTDLLPDETYLVRVTPVDSCESPTGPSIDKVIRTSHLCYVCHGGMNNKACTGKQNTIECLPGQDACINIVRNINGVRRITKRCAKWDPNHVNIISRCSKRTCVCMCRKNLCNQRMLPCMDEVSVLEARARSITFSIHGASIGSRYWVMAIPLHSLNGLGYWNLPITSHQESEIIDDNGRIMVNLEEPGYSYRISFIRLKSNGREFGSRKTIVAQTAMECFTCEGKECEGGGNIEECPVGTNACLNTLLKTYEQKWTKQCAVTMPGISSTCTAEHNRAVCYYICGLNRCNKQLSPYIEEWRYFIHDCNHIRVVRKKIPGRIHSMVAFVRPEREPESNSLKIIDFSDFFEF